METEFSGGPAVEFQPAKIVRNFNKVEEMVGDEITIRIHTLRGVGNNDCGSLVERGCGPRTVVWKRLFRGGSSPTDEKTQLVTPTVLAEKI